MGYLGLSGQFGIAHRGGSHEHLENSPSAFRHAAGLGFPVIETDVHATNDGQLVVVHDPNLSRTSDHQIDIHNSTLDQLSTLRLRNGDPLMTLSQAFEVIGPDIRLNIDPKADTAVEPLARFLVDNPDLAGRVCVGSFSSARLRRFRALAPTVATSLGGSEVRDLVLAARTRNQRYRTGGAVAAQVPEKAMGLRIVNRQFVDFVHSLDMQVHVWTVDDESDMHRLYDLGVNAVMTDRPTVLRDVLVARGLWKQD